MAGVTERFGPQWGISSIREEELAAEHRRNRRINELIAVIEGARTMNLSIAGLITKLVYAVMKSHVTKEPCSFEDCRTAFVVLEKIDDET